jgi:hypothetical protein
MPWREHSRIPGIEENNRESRGKGLGTSGRIRGDELRLEPAWSTPEASLKPMDMTQKCGLRGEEQRQRIWDTEGSLSQKRALNTP